MSYRLEISAMEMADADSDAREYTSRRVEWFLDAAGVYSVVSAVCTYYWDAWRRVGCYSITYNSYHWTGRGRP